MKSKQALVPKLRFGEFEDDWKATTLGKESFFHDAKRIPLSQQERSKMQGKYRYYGASSVIDHVNDYIFDGDYVLLGEDGANILDRNSPLAFVVTGKIWVNNHAHVIEAKGSTCFLAEALERLDYNQYNSGTAQPKLNSKTCHGIKFTTPALPEQEKIAAFLTSVDDRIDQLKRKKSLLQDYKKGAMQKLFSQELRFKDEQGKDFPDWEEKKLGEVAEVVGGGTPDSTNEAYWKGDVQWFTPSEIRSKFAEDSKRTISQLGLKKSSARVLPIGAILLTSRATIAEVSIATRECTTNQGFQSLIVQEGHHNEFVYYWIIENKKEFLRKSQGSTFLEISGKEIRKFKIIFPYLPEQTKIANFLSSLDQKIEQVDTQITQTQTFKKGLLQQMFV